MAVFTAVYVGYGLVSGATVTSVTRGIDSQVVGAASLVILSSYRPKSGLPSVMAFVAGVLYQFAVPALGPYLFPGLFFFGLAYDGYMSIVGYDVASERRHVVGALTLGGVVFSLTAVGVIVALQLVPLGEAFVLGGVFTVAFVLASIAGGMIGLFVVERIRRHT